MGVEKEAQKKRHSFLDLNVVETDGCVITSTVSCGKFEDANKE